MAEMEGASNVGGRDHDAIGRFSARRIGVEIALLHPELIETALGVLRVVLLGEVDGLHSRAIFRESGLARAGSAPPRSNITMEHDIRR